MKTVLACAASLALCLVLAVPASAGGNGAQTSTVTLQNQFATFPNNPPLCNSPQGQVSITFNVVFHLTVQSDGTFSDTGTMAGTLVFVPTDASLPTFTGTIADWFGDQGVATFGQFGPINGTATDTSTMMVQAMGSDGSKFDAHSVFKGQFAIVNGAFIPLQILINKATC